MKKNDNNGKIIVRLIWKSRVTRAKRAAIMAWIRKHYNRARDMGDCVEIYPPHDCTKFIWIFMLSKTFKDIE